jgi:uncharacterized membrane protein YeaQ/YmgE (transglycosylase-associated protein family)
VNTKNLLIASLIGAVVTTAFANIPIINLLNCLLCAPFWGGPLLAAWFYRHQTGNMTMKHAISVGVLTGIFAGLLGFLLSFVGMAGASGLASQLKEFIPAGSVPPEAQLVTTGPMAMLFNFAGALTNIIFGMIGGLIGGAIFKNKSTASQLSQ